MPNQDQGEEDYTPVSRSPSNEEPTQQLQEVQAQENQDHLKPEEDTNAIVQVKKEETPLIYMAIIPPHHDQRSLGPTSPARVKKEETPLVSLEDIPQYQGQGSSGRVSPRQTRRIDYNELAKSGVRVEKKE